MLMWFIKPKLNPSWTGKMKKAVHIIAAGVFIVLAAMSLYYRHLAKQEHDTVVVADTLYTVITETVVDVKEVIIPARIDTVYIQGEVSHEIARMDTLITKDKARVDLSVSYDTLVKVFSMDLNVDVDRDSVFVYKEIQNFVKVKPSFIKPMIGVSMLYDEDSSLVFIDAGARIADKFYISGIISSNNSAGLRLGINF